MTKKLKIIGNLTRTLSCTFGKKYKIRKKLFWNKVHIKVYICYDICDVVTSRS